ncbi:MAG: DUF924 domain-containing protein [Halomonadaceae bacterium]|nr:MAG: DUF924 domain-containing protein [Halomonadaceae bacterium]
MFEWPYILDYWFGELTPQGLPDLQSRQFWFNASRRDDQVIRRRFFTMVLLASEDGLRHWRAEPGGALAEILLLDQFSRHIHRRQSLAFRNDALALKLAREGVDRGRDVSLPMVQRAFFYMPFQHSERLRVQKEGLDLYYQLVRTAEGPLRELLENFYRSAQRHHDIVARFGRFPHRNAVLKRPSSEEERTWLAQDRSGFGQ